MGRFKSMYLDEPIAPLDRARFLTDRVIAKKGNQLGYKGAMEKIQVSSFCYMELVIILAATIYLLSL